MKFSGFRMEGVLADVKLWDVGRLAVISSRLLLALHSRHLLWSIQRLILL